MFNKYNSILLLAVCALFLWVYISGSNIIGGNKQWNFRASYFSTKASEAGLNPYNNRDVNRVNRSGYSIPAWLTYPYHPITLNYFKLFTKFEYNEALRIYLIYNLFLILFFPEPDKEDIMPHVAVIAGIRTPFIKAKKSFENLGPLQLGAHTVQGLLERDSVDPMDIEAFAFGVVVHEPGIPNPAREIIFQLGLPALIEAQTLSSYCITGLRSITAIADAITQGRISVGLAGGADSLSMASTDMFKEPSTGLSIGEHMEITREEWDIGREEQDRIARTGLYLEDMDLIEVHEAFGAQVAANVKAWERGWKGDPTGPLDWDRINVNGSSIAIGHPWSATGGRIVITLANEMARRDARFGLVSICAAGAMAGAMILEKA